MVWDDAAQRVIRMIVEGHWTWEEMQDARDDVGHLLDTVAHEVTVLLDLVKSHGFPEGYLWQFHKLYGVSHINSGPIVMISEDRLVQPLVEMLNRLDGDSAGPRMMYAVATLEEAQTLARSFQAGAGNA